MSCRRILLATHNLNLHLSKIGTHHRNQYQGNLFNAAGRRSFNATRPDHIASLTEITHHHQHLLSGQGLPQHLIRNEKVLLRCQPEATWNPKPSSRQLYILSLALYTTENGSTRTPHSVHVQLNVKIAYLPSSVAAVSNLSLLRDTKS